MREEKERREKRDAKIIKTNKKKIIHLNPFKSFYN